MLPIVINQVGKKMGHHGCFNVTLGISKGMLASFKQWSWNKGQLVRKAFDTDLKVSSPIGTAHTRKAVRRERFHVVLF